MLQRFEDAAQRGILSEDDRFKVVHDPGADKLEKKILGPVFPICNRRDTGGVRTSLLGSRQSGTPRTTQLFQPIGSVAVGQFVFRGFARYLRGWWLHLEAIPLAKGLRRRDPFLGNRQHTIGFGQVGQGRHLLPTALAEHRAANQKQGNVGAGFGGNLQIFFGGQGDAKLFFQANQGGDGVGRTCSQATLDGKAFIDMDGDFRRDVLPLQRALDNLPAGIAVIAGNIFLSAAEEDFAGRSAGQRHGGDVDKIVDGEGLVDRRQRMKAIRPRRTDGQAKIDFCVRSYAGGHAATILNGCSASYTFSIGNARMPMKKLLTSCFTFLYCCLLALTAAAQTTPDVGIDYKSEQPVRTRHAMVVTVHHDATDAGVEILKQGGNAVDAAVAVGFALAVVHPEAGNIGGGGFMLVRFKNGKSHFMDYREEAPGAATMNMYLDAQGNVIPDASTVGYRSIGVPGSVAGMVRAEKLWGKLTLAQVMQPAIRLARNGFVLSDEEAEEMQDPLLTKFPASRHIFQRDGDFYRAGETFRQPELAATLERIAKNPREFFITGRWPRRSLRRSRRAAA